MSDAINDAAMRLGNMAADAVERELQHQLDSGALVSGVARVENEMFNAIVMSGSLVLSEVRTVREGYTFRIMTLRFGDGMPLEDWEAWR